MSPSSTGQVSTVPATSAATPASQLSHHDHTANPARRHRLSRATPATMNGGRTQFASGMNQAPAARPAERPLQLNARALPTARYSQPASRAQASTWVTASSAAAPRYEKISTVPGVSPPRSAASRTAHSDASGLNAHSRSAAAAAASAVIAAVPDQEGGRTRGPPVGAAPDPRRAATSNPTPCPTLPSGAGTG